MAQKSRAVGVVTTKATKVISVAAGRGMFRAGEGLAAGKIGRRDF
jgi:hypothetical protein